MLDDVSVTGTGASVDAIFLLAKSPECKRVTSEVTQVRIGIYLFCFDPGGPGSGLIIQIN